MLHNVLRSFDGMDELLLQEVMDWAGQDGLDDDWHVPPTADSTSAGLRGKNEDHHR